MGRPQTAEKSTRNFWMSAPKKTGGVWEERKDDGGRTFYFNASTGVSQWQRPQGLAFALSPSKSNNRDAQIARSPDGAALFEYDFRQGT